MAPADLHYLGLSELSALLAARTVSAVEVMEHTLTRIERLDGRLHAFAWLDPEAALHQARLADQRFAKGDGRALEGVPVAVKDLFDTADMPTAAGMAIHRGVRPDHDATVVRRLREAGAINIGKTQMTEGAFALHHPSITPPLNPWGADLWPGASSSGSGVAVAAGLAYASLGSDTGGSIRFPSAANGLTGLKPSWGRVSRYGAFELAASLDHIGPIARSARDVALIQSLIAGHDPSDPTSWPGEADFACSVEDIAGLRIGMDPRWNSEGCDDAVIRAVNGAAETLRTLGAEVCEIDLPDLSAASRHWELLAGTEAAVAHERTYPARSAEYGPALSRLLDIGRSASAMDHQRALLDRMALTGALDSVLAGIDCLLMPVQPYAAPTLERLGELAADPEANARLIAFTAPFNLGGQPALCLPAQPADGGAPVGVQLVAARGREALLLGAGIAFQRVTGWHRAHPQM